jgi:hypothetical protein
MTKYIGKGVDILQIVDNDNSINIFFLVENILYMI